MLSFSITLPALLTDRSRIADRILARFQEEAGKKIVEAVQNRLGHSDLYSLSQTYSAKKLAGETNPRMKQYAGKDADEPLILSGEMFEAISWHPQGDLLVVQVEDGKADADGDYSEKWEERTHYLEKGFEDVEESLAELLGTIIMEEMLI